MRPSKETGDVISSAPRSPYSFSSQAKRCKLNEQILGRYHLPQPGMRDLTQHTRDDPQRRHRTPCGRVSQNPAIARFAGAADRQDGTFPRDLLREKGTPFSDLGLGDTSLSDEQLVDAMMEHPILINRPIVVAPMGVKLCRPSEVVLDILPAGQQAAFTKEDGEVVVDRTGRRVV